MAGRHAAALARGRTPRPLPARDRPRLALRLRLRRGSRALPAGQHHLRPAAAARRGDRGVRLRRDKRARHAEVCRRALDALESTWMVKPDPERQPDSPLQKHRSSASSIHAAGRMSPRTRCAPTRADLEQFLDYLAPTGARRGRAWRASTCSLLRALARRPVRAESEPGLAAAQDGRAAIVLPLPGAGRGGRRSTPPASWRRPRRPRRSRA